MTGAESRPETNSASQPTMRLTLQSKKLLLIAHAITPLLQDKCGVKLDYDAKTFRWRF
jgi:hypothetical protein